ncbi:MAG TPA: protein kinase [Pirellulales bacterium]
MNSHDRSQIEAAGSQPADGAAGELLDDPRVAATVQEYLCQLEAGNAPDRQAYLNRHPELASAVALCLDGLELVRAVAPRVKPHDLDFSVGGKLETESAREFAPRALGDFQILSELGRGGMGVVYEAVQLSLGRRVALKVLPFAATFDARQLQRFKNEAQAAALLHHTNIVPVYAVGSERGVHFYAMQLIEGQSLAVLLRQWREQAGLPATAAAEGRSKSGAAHAPSRVDVGATDVYLGGVVPAVKLAPVGVARSTAGGSLTITARTSRGGDTLFQKTARLVLQAAEALDHAHQLGIVHRDIKPANLLVNTAGTLWVADFGLAQFQTDTGLTRTGDMLGTFRYMSPELAAGQRTAVDHRTDIYSLGATFYELLTLEPVFAGETRQELLYQILHSEPRAPRAVNRSIPIELETIVLKALRKMPAERYTTAADFAEDLKRFLQDRPILARRPSPLDRARKWSRRHPSAVIAALVLFVFSMIGLAVSNWLIAAEQQKTADALDREKLRANEAEELFGQAKQAVDVLVEVSEVDLADNPSVESTRRRMLQSALNFYQDLIEQHRGNEASQADLARVEQRVKGILRELNLLQRDAQTALLANPLVLDELKVDDQQRRRLAELLSQWEDRKRLWARSEKADDETRRRRLVELAEQREQTLAEVLSPAQRARLRQLGVQSQGLFALKEPDIVSELELTPRQRVAIRKIEREAFARAFPREKHRDREDHLRWARLVFQEAMANATPLLTDTQLRRWNVLTGPKIAGLEWPFPGPSEGRKHGP